jgi:hypothetical protein
MATVIIMKKPKRYYLTLLWTIQTDLIIWILICLYNLFFGKKLQWIDGLILQCESKKPHLFKMWGKVINGLSLGHGMICAANRIGSTGADTKIEKHESGHVEQWESNCLFSTVIAAILFFLFVSTPLFVKALFIIVPLWFFGGFLIYFSRSIQAWIRGENIYMGNADEESMYSQYK